MFTRIFEFVSEVCDNSGFTFGYLWAGKKAEQCKELRIAFRVWWGVRMFEVPYQWCSAWVCRHRWSSPLAKATWVLGALAAVGWYGPSPVLLFVPWPMPGIIGWLAALGMVVAFIFYTPRLRGMTPLRPLKAALLVGTAYWVYWALTSVTFHYIFGVDPWSHLLWDDVARVWYQGGNLRWAAFWLLAGDTLAWYAMLFFLWPRIPRVWVAYQKWGGKAVHWFVRTVVFLGLTYCVFQLMGVQMWQKVDQLARALNAVVVGSQTLEVVEPWAIAFVLLVFGTVLANWLFLGLEIVSDFLCLCSKAFKVFLHGGYRMPGPNADPEEKLRRITGLFERFDRQQEIANEWHRAYMAARLDRERRSNITSEGFSRLSPEEEALRYAEYLADGRRHGAKFRARMRRRELEGPWWRRMWRRKKAAAPAATATAEPAEGAPSGDDTTATPDPQKLAPETVETGFSDAKDTPALVVPDTTSRDSFLAPDGDEARTSESPPEGTPDDGSGGGHPPPREVEEEGLAAARAEEAQQTDGSPSEGAEDARLRQQDAVEETRIRARADEEFALYADADGSDLLAGDPEDADNPFDPDPIGFESEAATQFESWAGSPREPTGAFGKPFDEADPGTVEGVVEDDVENEADSKIAVGQGDVDGSVAGQSQGVVAPTLEGGLDDVAAGEIDLPEGGEESFSQEASGEGFGPDREPEDLSPNVVSGGSSLVDEPSGDEAEGADDDDEDYVSPALSLPGSGPLAEARSERGGDAGPGDGSAGVEESIALRDETEVPAVGPPARQGSPKVPDGTKELF